jgi:hypothetical protein
MAAMSGTDGPEDVTEKLRAAIADGLAIGDKLHPIVASELNLLSKLDDEELIDHVFGTVDGGGVAMSMTDTVGPRVKGALVTNTYGKHSSYNIPAFEVSADQLLSIPIGLQRFDPNRRRWLRGPNSTHWLHS